MKTTSFAVFVVTVACATFLPAEDMENRLVTEGKKINKWRAFFPNPIILDGTTYSFNQEFLKSMLARSLVGYKKARDEQKSSNGESTAVKSERAIAKASLAYEIMAAGQYASGTKELMSLLEQAEQLLGNEALPDGVSSPFYQIVGMASRSFKDKDGNSIDVDVTDLGPHDFHSLILESKMQIAARSQTADPTTYELAEKARQFIQKSQPDFDFSHSRFLVTSPEALGESGTRYRWVVSVGDTPRPGSKKFVVEVQVYFNAQGNPIKALWPMIDTMPAMSPNTELGVGRAYP